LRLRRGGLLCRWLSVYRLGLLVLLLLLLWRLRHRLSLISDRFLFRGFTHS
jgi:hypothetical protein